MTPGDRVTWQRPGHRRLTTGRIVTVRERSLLVLAGAFYEVDRADVRDVKGKGRE
jgi:hypothetical protein